jgi:hypothetical protein
VQRRNPNTQEVYKREDKQVAEKRFKKHENSKNYNPSSPKKES